MCGVCMYTTCIYILLLLLAVYLFRLNLLEVQLGLVLQARDFLCPSSGFDIDPGFPGTTNRIQPDHLIVVLEGLNLLALFFWWHVSVDVSLSVKTTKRHLYPTQKKSTHTGKHTHSLAVFARAP